MKQFQFTSESLGKAYLADLQKAFNSTERHDRPSALTVSALHACEREGLLFHGSPAGNLMSGIEPRPSNAMRGDHVVFAGKPWVALSCTAKWSDDDFEQGTRNGGRTPYMKARHQKAFDMYRAGGFIYALSPMQFAHYDGLTSFEFVSFQEVKPLWSMHVPHPVAFMRAMGVTISTQNDLAKTWR